MDHRVSTSHWKCNHRYVPPNMADRHSVMLWLADSWADTDESRLILCCDWPSKSSQNPVLLQLKKQTSSPTSQVADISDYSFSPLLDWPVQYPEEYLYTPVARTEVEVWWPGDLHLQHFRLKINMGSARLTAEDYYHAMFVQVLIERSGLLWPHAANWLTHILTAVFGKITRADNLESRDKN